MIWPTASLENSSIVLRSSASRVFGVSLFRCACALRARPVSASVGVEETGAPVEVQMRWNARKSAMSFE